MQSSCHEPVLTAFTARPSHIDTNKGDSYYKALYEKCKTRFETLKKEETSKSEFDIYETLEVHNIT